MKIKKKSLFAIIMSILLLPGIVIYMLTTNVSDPHNYKLYCKIETQMQDQNVEFSSYKITTKFGLPRFGKSDAEIGIIKYKSSIKDNNIEKILMKYGGAQDLKRIFPILCKKVVIDNNILIIRLEKNNQIIFSDDWGRNIHTIEIKHALRPYITDSEGNLKNGMYTITNYWYEDSKLFVEQKSYLSEIMEKFSINDFYNYESGEVVKCNKCEPILFRIMSSKDYGLNWVIEKYGVNKELLIQGKYIYEK